MNSEYLCELVKKASGGDEQAFEELYKSKAQSILFQTSCILSNRQEAEDAAQEVVLGMYQNICKLRDPEMFNVWLGRIISNVCASMIRKKMRRKEYLNLEDFEENIMDDRTEFLPAEYAEDAEMRDRIMGVIHRLPEKRKMAVMMYYYGEMSYAEIAVALQVTVSTVATNIMKAKKAIRRELEKQTGSRISTFGSLAAVPVLTLALHHSAAEAFPPSAVDRFVNACGSMLKTAPALAGGGAAAAAALPKAGASGGSAASGGTVAFAVAAATVAIAAGVTLAANPAGTYARLADQSPLPSSAQAATSGVPQPSDAASAAGGEGNTSDSQAAQQPTDRPPAAAGIPSPGDAAASGALPVFYATPVSGQLALVGKAGNTIDSAGLLDGITLTIYDAAGNAKGQTTTTAGGAYTFADFAIAASGQYSVQATLPEGGDLTAAGATPAAAVSFHLTPGHAATGAPIYLQPAKAPAAVIHLVSGDCDCGHLNPSRATLQMETLLPTEQDWKIVRESDGKTLYTGTGQTITTQLQRLYTENGDGVYTIHWAFADSAGNSGEAKQIIVIDTGNIALGQYT